MRFSETFAFQKSAGLGITFNKAGIGRFESHQLPENSLWHLWKFQ